MKLIIIFILMFNFLFGFEQITKSNFDDKVGNKKVIIDFYASWCPPCKIVNKHLTIYDKLKNDDVTIYKVDIDTQRELVSRFDIKSIPTLVYLKNGKPLFKESGIRNNKEIKANVDKYLH